MTQEGHLIDIVANQPKQNAEDIYKGIEYIIENEGEEGEEEFDFAMEEENELDGDAKV